MTGSAEQAVTGSPVSGANVAETDRRTRPESGEGVAGERSSQEGSTEKREVIMEGTRGVVAQPRGDAIRQFLSKEPHFFFNGVLAEPEAQGLKAFPLSPRTITLQRFLDERGEEFN